MSSSSQCLDFIPGSLRNEISTGGRIAFIGTYLHWLRAQPGIGPVKVEATRPRQELFTVEREQAVGVRPPMHSGQP